MAHSKKERLELRTSLFESLGLEEEEAIKVIDIFSSEGDLDDKIQRLTKLKIKKLDLVISALVTLMFYNAVLDKYMTLTTNPNIIEQMIKSPTVDIGNIILLISSFIYRHSLLVDKIGIILLIVPILVSTGVFSVESITKLIRSTAKQNKIDIKDILLSTNYVIELFTSSMDNPTDNVTKH